MGQEQVEPKLARLVLPAGAGEPPEAPKGLDKGAAPAQASSSQSATLPVSDDLLSPSAPSRAPRSPLKAVIQSARWDSHGVMWYQIRLLHGHEERFFEKRYSQFQELHEALRAGGDLFLLEGGPLEEGGPGLHYCTAKCLDDCDCSIPAAKWGATVVGINLGDGWLQVGKRYLPTALRGAPVVSLIARGVARKLPRLPRKGIMGIRHRLDVGGFNQKREEALQAYLDQVLRGVHSLDCEPALDSFFAKEAAVCRSVCRASVEPGQLERGTSFQSSPGR